jgi:lysyl-tRNA synthetase class 2
LIANGLEIANAYQELDDAVELERRFFEYNLQRKRRGKVEMSVDEVLLDSVGSIGIYSGVALGIDRLAMSLLGSESISQVNL